MFLPKPFAIQIDVAAATAAFPRLNTVYEKANFDPLSPWGWGRVSALLRGSEFSRQEAQIQRAQPGREMAGKPMGKCILLQSLEHHVDVGSREWVLAMCVCHWLWTNNRRTTEKAAHLHSWEHIVASLGSGKGQPEAPVRLRWEAGSCWVRRQAEDGGGSLEQSTPQASGKFAEHSSNVSPLKAWMA